MNVGLVVDATCDIPTSILERFNVHVLPTEIRGKDEATVDKRDPEALTDFYNQITAAQLAHSTTQDATSQSLVVLLREQLIYQYDHLLVVVPHFKLSKTQQHVREAMVEMQMDIDRLRKAANMRGSFKIRVIESESGFAGYGLVLYEALRLMAEKAQSVDQLKRPIDQFKKNIETIALPGHQKFNHQVLAGAPYNFNWVTLQKLKLTNTLPSLKVVKGGIERYKSFSISNAENDFFNMIYDDFTRLNLQNKLVNISYAGKLSRLRVLSSFKALQEHIISKGGKLIYSSMSPTTAAQLGLGAISIAYPTD